MQDEQSPVEGPLPSAVAGEPPEGVQAPIESAETPLGNLISRDPVTVSATAPLTEALALFREHGISHLPVVEAHGRLVGLLSKSDVVRALDESPAVRGSTPQATEVVDLMQRELVTIPEVTTIARAAQVMASFRLHSLLVVADGDRLVGLVTSMDIVGWVGGAP